MASTRELSELANEEPGLLSVISGHGWNPFYTVSMDDIEFHGGVPSHNLNIPDWDLDKLPSPYEYYKRTIYGT